MKDWIAALDQISQQKNILTLFEGCTEHELVEKIIHVLTDVKNNVPVHKRITNISDEKLELLIDYLMLTDEDVMAEKLAGVYNRHLKLAEIYANIESVSLLTSSTGTQHD